MRIQDQFVKLTQHALDDVCRAALAVPEDKRSWSPMGEVRSVLSQMREVAATAGAILPTLTGNTPRETHEGLKARVNKDNPKLSTVEDCVEEAKKSFAVLCQEISSFPDTKLDEETMVPFTEAAMTMADVLLIPYWNLVYHHGQINQIQLMLGDKEMH